MTPATLGLIILIIAAAAMAVLFIHKLTVGRALRIVGNAFIAAGDASDHFSARFRDLKIEERQTRGGEA